MHLAIANITNGGLSFGCLKYLQKLLPILADDGRLDRLDVYVPPRTLSAMPECPSHVSYSTWPEGDPHSGFRWLRKELSRLAPDLVFFPTQRRLDCGPIPTVVMLRNTEPFAAPWFGNRLSEKLKNLVRAKAAARACRRANRVIAVSQYVQELVVQRLGVPAERVGLVYHGLDTIARSEPAIRPARLPAGVNQFLFTAGSIRPARGVEDAIEALAHLRASHPSLELAIAGAPSSGTEFWQRKMERLAQRRGVSQRVHWLGHLNQPEMDWCFNNATLFLMTSRAEACPNTVLEAMSHGSLVVSTDQPPMPEFFGQSAWYYRGRDSRQLAEQVLHVLAAPDFERQRAQMLAVERAREFDWSRTARETVEQLLIAAENSRRPSIRTKASGTAQDGPSPSSFGAPGRRVLVTGGSGFIGTHLVQSLLDGGAEVLNIDIAPPKLAHHREVWNRADILHASEVLAAFADFRPTHVVHLAARTDLDERKSLSGYRVNIEGTQHVLDAIRATSSVERAIVTSSMLVCRLGYQPASDLDYTPTTLYGQSKVLTETLTREANLPCDWTILRPTTIWGPWQLRLRDGFFRVLRRGWYYHPANDTTRRTYGYVGNTVHQIRRILVAPAGQIAGQILYLGDPPIDLGDWVNQFSLRLRGENVKTVPISLLRGGAWLGDLAGALGISLPLNSYRLRNLTCNNVLDVSPTLEITGAQPYSVADGIEATSQWLEAQFARASAPDKHVCENSHRTSGASARVAWIHAGAR